MIIVQQQNQPQPSAESESHCRLFPQIQPTECSVNFWVVPILRLPECLCPTKILLKLRFLLIYWEKAVVPNDCGSKWRFESVKFSIIFRFSRISKRDSPELCRRENISYAQVPLTDTPAKLFLPLKYQVTKNLTNTAVKTFIRDWDCPSGSFACWPGTGQPGPCCSHLKHTNRMNNTMHWTLIQYHWYQ